MDLTDIERGEFLEALDEADVSLTDWEMSFLESNLGREHFSDPQREVIDKLIQKYGPEVKGWEP